MLPLSTCYVVTVTISDGPAATLRVHLDPPHQTSSFGTLLRGAVRALDVAVEFGEADKHLYATFEASTGEFVREQVLGWDDFYSESHWEFLEAAKRVAIEMSPAFLADGMYRFLLLTSAVRVTRGAQGGRVRLPVGVGETSTTGPVRAEQRSWLLDRIQSGRELQKAVADRIASEFRVDERGRFDISSQQYKDYRAAVAVLKDLKSIADGWSAVAELEARTGTLVDRDAIDLLSDRLTIGSDGQLEVDTDDFEAYRSAVVDAGARARETLLVAETPGQTDAQETSTITSVDLHYEHDDDDDGSAEEDRFADVEEVGDLGDLQSLAESIFDIWLGGAEVRWAAFAWDVLQRHGLTDYEDDVDRTRVIARLVALAGINREFCAHAFDEGAPSEWRDSTMINLSYHVGDDYPAVDLMSLGRLAEREGVGWPDVDDRESPVSVLLDLAEGEWDQVAGALSAELGDSNLFATLWESRHDETRYPLPDDVLDEAVNTDPWKKQRAFQWVYDGMSRFG